MGGEMDGVDVSFEGELRAFMRWTRDTLACIKNRQEAQDGKLDEQTERLHAIERHCDTQNGNITLAMERERETHSCCGKAHELALKNANEIVALKVSTRAEREHDRQREGEMRSEVEWLRENVWKIALGGVSLLALVDQVAAIVQRLGAP